MAIFIVFFFAKYDLQVTIHQVKRETNLKQEYNSTYDWSITQLPMSINGRCSQSRSCLITKNGFRNIVPVNKVVIHIFSPGDQQRCYKYIGTRFDSINAAGNQTLY